MESIYEELAYSVKHLFEKHRFSSVTVASDEQESLHLIHVLEAIFLHGSLSPKGVPWSSEIQANRGLSSNLVSFWPFLEGRICEEDMERLHVLRYVDSDVRKCKSWLRMILNTAHWLTALKDLVGNQRALTAHYEDSAFLRNENATYRMFSELRKISTLKFQYNFTGLDMMTWSESTLHLSGIVCADDSDSNGDSGGRISPPDSDFPATSKDNDSPVIPLRADDRRENYQFKEFHKNYKEALKLYSLSRLSSRPPNSDGQQRIETVHVREALCKTVPCQVDESYQLAKAFEFEVLEVPFHQSHAGSDGGSSTTLTAMLTALTCERGLDAQDYKCSGCKKPIGMIFDEAKVCYYTSQYFCTDCHCDEERIIPARILYNWDFGKHTVASHSAAFLDSIAFEPLFDLVEINEQLYIYVPELREVRDLRLQLHHLKNFILTCREEEVKAIFAKKFPSSYIYDNTHMYSLGVSFFLLLTCQLCLVLFTLALAHMHACVCI
jgi:hypothetical protein